MRIFTGNYYECNAGNLISISGDRGKQANFIGKAIPQLAPKKAFWEQWHNNIGKISDEDNIRFYIREYYRNVLSKVNIKELLKGETDPILLCYERNQDFCHRHVLANFIELTYGIEVKDIKIDKSLNIEENKRPEYIKKYLTDIIEQEKGEGR